MSQTLNGGGQIPWMKTVLEHARRILNADVVLNMWMCWNIILEVNAQELGKVSEESNVIQKLEEMEVLQVDIRAHQRSEYQILVWYRIWQEFPGFCDQMLGSRACICQVTTLILHFHTHLTCFQFFNSRRGDYLSVHNQGLLLSKEMAVSSFSILL